MYTLLDPRSLTVFVTGATSGFGEATARRFLAEGSRVIATGRRADRLEALASDGGAERLHVLAFDVRRRAAVEAAVASLPPEFAAVNVVVANAGLALGLEPGWEAKLDDWATMIDTNVSGLVYTVRALLPGMVERNEGHVVTLGSIAGDYPYPGAAVYAGTKAFVKQFSLALYADLHGKNVRATNIEPGLAETEFSIVRFKGDTDRAGQMYADTLYMTGEDIAESIFWACTLPRHLNINRIQMMPVSQTFAASRIHRG